MTFKFSKRSLGHLEGVDPKLQRVMARALAISKVDFGIIDGLRTQSEQRALVASGASQTMSSKHLTGHAVDVMAYVGSRGSWEAPLYHKIADAVRDASIELDVSVRWGGAWQVPDVGQWAQDMEAASRRYIAIRVAAGRMPFVDSGHFELSGDDYVG